jgi:multiple sugar transport system substrate-binding protein
MKTGRSVVSVFLVLVLMLAIMTGCSTNDDFNEVQPTQESSASDESVNEVATEESTQEKITLNFWNGFTGPDGEVLKEIVNRFNEAHKDSIEIKMDVMGWDVLAQKLPTAMMTDTAPEMVLMIGDWIPQYLANDNFQDLDDFWSVTGLEEESYLKNVLDLGKFEDSYYSLPMQFNLIYLYWNKILFEEAGLDPNSPPATMDELADYAVLLTDPSINQYGLALPVKGAPQYWTSFFWNNGGELFNLETKESLLNSPENIATLEWIDDLAEKGVSPIGSTGAELDNLFMSGKLGMVINGPWLINGIKSNNIDFGITAPPAGSERQEVIAGSIGFCIPSGVDQAHKEAAYEFIEFWMSDEIIKEWSVRNGFPAWSHNVIADEEVMNDPVLGAISPLSELGRGYNPEAFEGISAIDGDALWPMIEAVIVGDDEPADIIKITSDEIDNIFSQYK